jgi:hypothetical protein
LGSALTLLEPSTSLADVPSHSAFALSQSKMSLVPHTTHYVVRHRQSRRWSAQGSSCFPFPFSYIVLSVVSGHIQKAMDKPSRTFTVVSCCARIVWHALSLSLEAISEWKMWVSGFAGSSAAGGCRLVLQYVSLMCLAISVQLQRDGPSAGQKRHTPITYSSDSPANKHPKPDKSQREIYQPPSGKYSNKVSSYGKFFSLYVLCIWCVPFVW